MEDIFETIDLEEPQQARTMQNNFGQREPEFFDEPVSNENEKEKMTEKEEEKSVTQNEVFIRGMIVGRIQHDDRTTLVLSSRSVNREESNYQYVSFRGDLKKDVDANYKVSDVVVVTAEARIFRDSKTKAIQPQAIRLHGYKIELSRDFSKRVVAASGIPIYGIQFKDCVRFTFSGVIASIEKAERNRVSILLRTPNQNEKGYNLIPLMYSCREGMESQDDILQEYRRGIPISVKGFVSQRSVQQEHSRRPLYINTYYITSFLNSDADLDVE